MAVQFTKEDSYLSYLPLAHIFDRVGEEMMTFSGSSIGYWQGVSVGLALLQRRQEKESAPLCVLRPFDS